MAVLKRILENEMERINYRGYIIAPGLCGEIGTFVPEDGYQNGTFHTVESAKVQIDEWHAGWRQIIANCQDQTSVNAARMAIESCGEFE